MSEGSAESNRDWRLSREEQERASPGKGIALTAEEAERALAACWMLEESPVLAQLRAAGFIDKAFAQHDVRMVWNASCAVQDKGAHPTPSAVAAEIEASPDVDHFAKFGGYSGLLNLADKAATSAHWRFFAEFVKDAWRCRQLRWWLLKANEEVAVKAPRWKELRPQIAAIHRHIDELLTSGDERTAKEAFEDRTAYWGTVAAGTVDKSHRISLLPAVDRKLGVIDSKMGDELIVVAAGASVGKTSFSRQFVGYGVQREQNFAVFLLETSVWDYCMGMAQQRAKVSVRGLEHLPDDMKQKLWREFAGVKQSLGKHLFLWDDVYEIDDIEMRARAQARSLAEEGRKLHGIVIDYIQIARAGDRVRRNAQREEIVAHLASRCKFLARELKCPVFALCQINRESQKENRPPRMSDLRESAALEHAADRILMLWCPQKDPRGVEQSLNQSRVYMAILQTKNRYGPQGMCGMWLDRPWTLFSDLGKGDEDLENGGAGQPAPIQPKNGPPASGAKGKTGYGRAGEVEDDRPWGD